MNDEELRRMLVDAILNPDSVIVSCTGGRATDAEATEITLTLQVPD